VVRGGADDVHAGEVAQSGGAVTSNAEVIALDEIVGGAAAGQENTAAAIARNDVTGSRRGAADGVVVGAALDQDAVFSVARRAGARSIGADPVAGDDDAGHRRAADIDAVPAKFGDDEAFDGDIGRRDGETIRRAGNAVARQAAARRTAV